MCKRGLFCVKMRVLFFVISWVGVFVWVFSICDPSSILVTQWLKIILKLLIVICIMYDMLYMTYYYTVFILSYLFLQFPRVHNKISSSCQNYLKKWFDQFTMFKNEYQVNVTQDLRIEQCFFLCIAYFALNLWHLLSFWSWVFL